MHDGNKQMHDGNKQLTLSRPDFSSVDWKKGGIKNDI